MSGKRTDIEEICILQLKEGYRSAFNHIFQTYNQKLYFFALGYLKSEKEAEEIVQETFMKIWERREYIDPELSINAYLFKIAFNFIQKRLKKNFREEEMRHNLTEELVLFDDYTANMLNYHFLLQRINQLIDELPPRQKEVIVLRKLEGFTTQEISEKLSLSLKTVEAHLTSALKFLKKHLQTEKFEDLLLFALTFRKKN